MSDLVVSVPRGLWSEWIDEGDQVGTPETGIEWGFFLGHSRPPIKPGDRLYIVAHDRVRGYAPVTRVAFFVDPCTDSWCGVGGPDCDQCRLHETEGGHATKPRLASGRSAPGRWAIGRKGGAVAVTIHGLVRGFRGWRKRWWSIEDEVPFPEWQTDDMWLNRVAAKRKREDKKAEREAKVVDQGRRQGSLFGVEP
jgi:hypothetical protein